MKRRGIFFVMLACFMLSACGMKGTKGSAPKDDSKVAKESMAENREEEGEEMVAFQTADTVGTPATEKIFSDKDITMVSIWGTFCSACIGELPDLQEISEKLPENGAIVGIIADVPNGEQNGMEKARRLLEENGVTFRNLYLDEALTSFTNDISLLPTTIFVNREGKIVGETVKGARPEAYIEQLEALLEGFRYR